MKVNDAFNANLSAQAYFSEICSRKGFENYMDNSIRCNTADVFEQLYNSCYQRLVSYASARLGDYRDFSEDCVQEAFVVFHGKLKDGENFQYPEAFLYRTVDNIVKKQRSKRFAEESMAVSIDDENNEIVLKSEENIDYEKYIRLLEKKLTPEEKKLYIAKYVQEKKIEEIAKEKDMTVAAVTMRLSRLRQKVKKELDEIII